MRIDVQLGVTTHLAVLGFVTFLLILGGGAGPLFAATQVQLTVTERLGISRLQEPVTSGIPIPRGELDSVEKVRLLRNGREVPAQFRALGLWRPTKSIRWLLVDFQTDIRTNEKQAFTLEYGKGVESRVKTSMPIGIQEDGDGYTVNTGAATFRLSKRTFSLFDEVKLADGTVLVSRAATGISRYGAAVRGLRRTVTRAIPAPGNKGRSHLIYVKCGEDAELEDYTLTFVADREYQVAEAEWGAVGKGAYLKDFTSKYGKISIPADAWLRYRNPQEGDVYTFRTIPEGTSALSKGVYETKVLEAGPLRSVIRIKGSFGPASAPVMEYTAWYHFYAGSPRVKLAFTLENNDFGGRTSTGNARNANIGGINCIFFNEMVLALPLNLSGRKTVSLMGDVEAGAKVLPLDVKVELYQDSNGGERWNRYRNPKYHPRPNSYVTFKGYRILKGERKLAAGSRALGWMDVSDGSKGLTLTVQDFWQNFPKALSASPDGMVEIGLFPGRYAGDFPFRSGEHKTHEMLFLFHEDGANAAPGEVAARGFSEPLRLEPTPRWFAETKALGYLHPFDSESYRAYEVRNLSTIGIFPEGVKPGPSVLGRREEHDFYGWMDYGDVSMDFESPSGQWGMKYDLDYQMAKQYARTLNSGWWDLLVAASKHMRDIDIHHQPHYPAVHYVKGGVWAHSLHNEPGHKNPNRNYNHFTKDLCFGARGTAAFYYLTGDWKAHDSCLEIAENALARYMSPQEDPGDPKLNNRMGVRGDGCTLNRLLEGYLLSGDEKFLQRARWQIKACAFDGKPAQHKAISLWSSTFYMMALARYVEMFPEDASAKSYLLAHLETLRKGTRPDTGMMYTITPQPDGSVVGERSTSHYNIMGSDALSFGYLLTGDMRFMETARRSFAYGVKNACWVGGPPTYFHIHSANGATHGNVFMMVDSKLRARGN